MFHLDGSDMKQEQSLALGVPGPTSACGRTGLLGKGTVEADQSTACTSLCGKKCPL